MKRFAYLFLAFAACVDPAVTEDGIDDSFLVEGKTDTGGISDGTAEAVAVLRVANERTATELTNHGVPPMASKNIIAVRVGDDASSAADDVRFTSLVQLDAVPYVGPQAFARLLAYANELGYLTPTPTPAQPPANLWHVAACPQITWSQLVAKFRSGATTFDFHRPWATASRHRDTCNAVTGCTPWQNGGATVVVEHLSNSAFEVPSGTRGNVEMGLLPNDDDRYIWLDLTNAMPASTPDVQFTCYQIEETNDSTVQCHVYRADGPHLSFGGNTLLLDGRICADGSYHFVSNLTADLSDTPDNLNQLALYGQLF